MIVAVIEAAVAGGATRVAAGSVVGLSVRTQERWRGTHPVDARHGPHHALASRDLSPHQIVPRLADLGRHIGSETTIYRVLRAEPLLTHRGRAKPPTVRHVTAQIAHGPNQVWSWDITSRSTPVRGVFLSLYLILDV